MKKLFILLFLLPGAVIANSMFNKLVDVNKQWVYNKDGIQLLEKSITQPNKDLILSHLMLVEKVLRSRTVTHLSENQKLNRQKYLDILRQYWMIGIVPTNDYSSTRVPVFIDRKGVHCAVGYLLQQGGFENIARKIDNENKFVYVFDIKTPELFKWQEESGLTVEELAWIQPSYPYPGSAISFGSGLKGEVRDIKNSTGKYSLIAAGKFKIEGDTNNVVLAGWDGKIWNAIIKAGTGIINKIEVQGNTITSYGGDISFGNFNKVEILETDITNTQPTHKLKGELNGTITDFENYNGKKYVCGTFSGGLAVFDSSNWVVIPSPQINNPTSIRVYNGKLYITGIMISKGSYSLVAFDGLNFSTNDFLPKQPSYLHVYGNKLFIGLKSERYTDTLIYTKDKLYLTKFDSLKNMYGKEVRCIVSRENKLLVTGVIDVSNFFYYSSGLALHNRKKSDESDQIININNFVNTGIINSDNTITVGGNFTSYLKYNGFYTGVSSPIFGCATVFEDRLIGSLNKISYEKSQLLYPNPTSGVIFIPESGQLFDYNGKMLMSLEKGQNDISELPNGLYFFICPKGNSRILKQ
jgi:hypothetical protein